MKSACSDVIIVGGGIIGMMTAWFLVRQNRRVTIIDQQQAGKEASWAGGGILSPLHPWRYPAEVTALAQWSQAYYPALDAELKDRYQCDMEYQRCGFFMQSGDELAAAKAWANSHGYDLTVLTQDEAEGMQPRVTWRAQPVIYMPSIGQTRNPRLLKALRRALNQEGVRFVEHAQVSPIVGEGRLTYVMAGAKRWFAGQFLVASGAWAHRVLPCLPSQEVFPVRGQMLQYQTPPGYLSSMIMQGSRYLIPRKDGRVIVGSTVEYESYNKFPTVGGRHELEQSASKMVPGLADFPIVNHWAGLRPGSPLGVPLMTRVPAFDNVFLSAGHYRNGLICAPASAKHLSELMTGAQTTLPQDWYGWRD